MTARRHRLAREAFVLGTQAGAAYSNGHHWPGVKWDPRARGGKYDPPLKLMPLRVALKLWRMLHIEGGK